MIRQELNMSLLDKVTAEVVRYEEKAEALRARLEDEPNSRGTKQSAALKRAALDLKQALTLITQSTQW